MTDDDVQIIAWTREGEPIVALPVVKAAKAVGLSRAALDQARDKGLIEYHNWGSKPLVLVEDLAPFVRNLPVG